MKKKIGFVTNSSSASFIVSIYSLYDDIEDFKAMMRKILLDTYFEDLKYNISEEDQKEYLNYFNRIIDTTGHIGPHTFEMIDFTAMLNDTIDDLPKWITYILVMKAMGSLYPHIKEVTLKVQED